MSGFGENILLIQERHILRRIAALLLGTLNVVCGRGSLLRILKQIVSWGRAASETMHTDVAGQQIAKGQHTVNCYPS